MHRGYIKLWRKVEDSPIWEDPNLWRLACYCLFKAAYKDRSFPVKTGRGIKLVKLKPGQLIWGRNVASERLNCAPKTAENRLKTLEGLDFCRRRVTTHYSIVTICNWDIYQNGAEEDCQPTIQPTIQPSANQVPTKCQPNTTSKEVIELQEQLELMKKREESLQAEVNQLRKNDSEDLFGSPPPVDPDAQNMAPSWVKELRRNSAKGCNPHNTYFPAWERLVQEHGETVVIRALEKVPAPERWPDNVEVKIQSEDCEHEYQDSPI